MLRDCEISNLDIENRLRDLEREKEQRSRAASSVRSGPRGGDGDGSTKSNASIDERLEEALYDEMSIDSGVGWNQDGTDYSRIIKPMRNASGQSQGGTQKSSTSRGWKTLFKGGNGTIRRPSGLRNGHGDERQSENYGGMGDIATNTSRSTSQSSRTATSSTNRKASVAGSESSATSNSMAAWALRMVGGNAPDNQPSKDSTTATGGTGLATREGQTTRGGTIRGKNGTIKQNKMAAIRSPRGSVSTYGPNGTLRSIPSDMLHSNTSGMASLHSPQASVDGAATNLGPVEMDTILPEDTRPPTLGQISTTDEFLTDNFGFIYDQRRRRKMNEATAVMPRNKRGSQVESLKNLRRVSNYPETTSDAASVASAASNASRPETPASVEEVPAKRWQDYLKLSGLKTELLSHTPSPAPITDITTSETDNAKATIIMSTRGSVPSNSKMSEPSTTHVVSENAEIASTSQPTSPGVTPETETDPVKALVDHLSEVHEQAQREKTLRWNEFLRKVRADRRRDVSGKGEADARSKGLQMPEVMLTDGEIIGIAGLGVRGKVGRAKANEFRNLVLAGIPTAYRLKIWAEGSGAVSLRIPGYYEDLIKSPFEDETIVQQIQMDITRTLTDNIYFRRGAGVEKLKEVLLAYARRNPAIGYCQGMNLITANLLLILPTAEDAFWVLTSMVENILPEGYYSPSLLTSRADQVVLRRYVAEILPQLSRHLDNLGIELEALTFQWFLSVFTDCLSAEALFRVWDVVLCLPDTPTNIAPKLNQTQPHGAATFLFQVALALLKLNETDLLACDNPAEIYRYINRGMTDHAISIDNLIRASEGLRREVRMEDVLERRREAVDEELEIMRKRESIRKGKSRAVDDSPPVPSTPKTNGMEKDATPKARKTLMRQPSRAELDEDREAMEYSELQIRTPMPIDEEFEWRA